MARSRRAPAAQASMLDVKVPQKGFDELRPDSLGDIQVFVRRLI